MPAVTEKRRWGKDFLITKAKKDTRRDTKGGSGYSRLDLQSLARLSVPLRALVFNNYQYPYTSPKCLLLLRKADGRNGFSFNHEGEEGYTKEHEEMSWMQQVGFIILSAP